MIQAGKADVGAYGLIVLMGLSTFIWSRTFPRAEEAYSGPGSFPAALGFFLLVLGAVGLYRVFRNPVASQREGEEHVGGPGRLLALGGLTAAYLLAMPYTGFISATALFFMLTIRVLGFRRWDAALAIGFLFAFGLYGVFGILMNVSLPKGWIG